jgi:hypothetical protein
MLLHAPACASVPACPAGWSQAALNDVIELGGNCRRTCYRTDLQCAVLPLETTDTSGAVNTCAVAPPPACPAGWTEAALSRMDKLFANCIRTCVRCN